MQVMLEVQSGASAGRKITLESGRSVRIGRTSLADVAFPGDPRMSGVHFVLECGDDGCVLRDAGSTNGTMVNGRRVDSAVLVQGDMVTAGETTFFVHAVKGEAPAPVVAAPKEAKPQDPLTRMLRNDFQPLYAILDAAREPSVLKVLIESGAMRQSLFEGVAGAHLAHFAPYLVALPADAPLIEALAKQAWGKSWGIFVASEFAFDDLRGHCRNLLTVRTPDGQAYFRFYDPRVLRIFLPTCLPEEVNALFGPVKYYLMEDEEPDVLLRFSNAGRGVGRKALPLTPLKVPAGQDSASGIAPAH